MRISLSATLVALTLLVAARPAAAQPDPLRDRFAARLEAVDSSDEAANFRQLWEVMDSVVLRELNAGRSANEVNRVLAGFPAYSGPSEGDGVTIGRTTFYGELPRELPSYVLLPVRAEREELLLAVYNFSVNGAGRVGLFARRGGRWTRTSWVGARASVTPYLLPLADSVLAIVTLDLFTGGDHQDGWVNVWRIDDGALRSLAPIPGRLKEPSATMDHGVIRVEHNRIPDGLAAPVMGTRIGMMTTITPVGTTVRMDTRITNPWVEVVSQYYEMIWRLPSVALDCLASTELSARLGSKIPMSYRDGGDLAAGTGWIVIAPGGGNTYYRVTSRRMPGGKWRITAVEPVPAPRDTSGG